MRRTYIRHVIPAIFSLFLLLFILSDITALKVYAEDIKLTDTDSEGTYYYSFKSGTFETNIKAGSTVDIGYIEWDDALSFSLMRNGQQMPYTKGDILFTGGNYIAFVYDLKSGEYTTFEFSIENDLGTESLFNNINNSSSDNEINGYNFDYSGFDSFDDINLEEELGIYAGSYGDFDSTEIGNISLKASIDADNGFYVYTGAGENIVRSTIPCGAFATTKDKVVIKTDYGVMIYVLKDGEMIDKPEGGIYDKPGFYDITAYLMNPNIDNISEDEYLDGAYIYQTHFYFYIVPDEFNNLGVIYTPFDYVYKSVNLNGEELNIPEDEYLFLENDGLYTIEFKSLAGLPDYTFSFKRDTKPPKISFDSIPVKNVVNEKLGFTVDDKAADVHVFLNGSEVKFTEGMTAYDPGWYRVVAEDIAGNRGEASVYLNVKYHFFSKGMIISLIILLLVFIVYIIKVRRGKYIVDEEIDIELNQNEETNNDSDNNRKE